jgi:Domain of unknown function (DUF4394)/Calx-beta domain
MRRAGWIAAAALGLALTGAGTASAAETVYGLTAADKLVTFSSDRPGSTSTPLAVTGLLAGETLVGVDVRPATGQLYGVGKLGTGGRLYRIDPVTGAATRITTTAFTLNGTDFGVDFNPVPDRLRIVSDANQSLRLNPNTGNAPTVDTSLTFAGGSVDPNAGDVPMVGAAAYTNPVPGNPTPTSGPADTLLYDLEAGNDVLATQDPPNNGVLNTRSPLGIDISTVGGFDIGAAGNAALASATPAGSLRPRLYAINLGAGPSGPAARDIGAIGGPAMMLDPVEDIAVAQDLFTFAAVTASKPQAVFTFRSDRPGARGPARNISGLQGGETIVGIDTRPANGDLLAVTDQNRVYSLDADTGAVSNPRTIAPSLMGTAFGVDVNPAADRLRVVSDAEQNQRLNPDTGASAVTGGGTDAPLAYATGDPGAGTTPDAVAAGYTNSVAGAPETLLYAVDAARNFLAVQDPPNDGVLRSVGTGGLGIGDITSVAALDIVPGLNTQFAAFQIAGQPTSKLYAVNGASAQAPTDQRGQAVQVGDFDGLVNGLAFLPTERLQFGAPRLAAREGDGHVQVPIIRNSTDGDGVTTSVSYATANGTGRAGEDYTSTSGTVTFQPGEAVKMVSIPLVDDRRSEPSETFTVSLSSPTGGVALGSPRATTVTINDDDRGAWKPKHVRTNVVIIVRDVKWSTLRKRGVKVVVMCNQKCSVSATLKLGRRPIGSVKTRLSKAGYTTTYVKLSQSGKRVVKPLAATRRLTVAATATADGGHSSATVSFRAKR